MGFRVRVGVRLRVRERAGVRQALLQQLRLG